MCVRACMRACLYNKYNKKLTFKMYVVHSSCALKAKCNFLMNSVFVKCLSQVLEGKIKQTI